MAPQNPPTGHDTAPDQPDQPDQPEQTGPRLTPAASTPAGRSPGSSTGKAAVKRPTKCGATNRSGGSCGRPAGWGTKHLGYGACKLHGGATPTHNSAAQRAMAAEAVAVFGLPIEVDAHTALLQELHRTAGAVRWLSEQVAELDESEIAWGVTRRKSGGDDHGVTREAKPNALVVLWQAERKHLVDVSRECIRAGIEERQVRLAEAQGLQLAQVVRAVLDLLELNEHQRELAAVVVPQQFRRLQAVPDPSGGA